MQTQLPFKGTMNDSHFQGFIGRTVDESQPWWPSAPRPTKGTPNVVVVVFDDVGFAHFNRYGSTIDTPNLNRLADGGLRFVNFHTTALCSPTRACMLTGRNHHAVGMRAISNFDTGFPNMRGAIPRSAATLAEMLRDQGFGTYMVGKWHLAPMHETGPAGPFRNWPLARGFDRFYGCSPRGCGKPLRPSSTTPTTTSVATSTRWRGWGSWTTPSSSRCPTTAPVRKAARQACSTRCATSMACARMWTKR